MYYEKNKFKQIKTKSLFNTLQCPDFYRNYSDGTERNFEESILHFTNSIYSNMYI